MKKMLVGLMLVAMSFGVYAGVKCVPDGRGGMCCWDTASEGPFKPIMC